MQLSQWLTVTAIFWRFKIFCKYFPYMQTQDNGHVETLSRESLPLNFLHVRVCIQGKCSHNMGNFQNHTCTVCCKWPLEPYYSLYFVHNQNFAIDQYFQSIRWVLLLVLIEFNIGFPSICFIGLITAGVAVKAFDRLFGWRQRWRIEGICQGLFKS